MAGRTLLFKILKPAKSFGAVNYNSVKVDKRKTARLVHFENFGHLQDKSVIGKEEFKKYLSGYSARNGNIKNPQFHAVLSAKGRMHDFDQLKVYALDIMYKMGYEGNPILIYEHHDTDNNHLHIVSSRVDIYGKKISDAFERNRAMSILNDILAISPELEWQKDLNATASYEVQNIAQFLLLLELKGYEIQKKEQSYKFYKFGKLQGDIAESRITISKDGQSAKNNGRVKSMRAIIKKYQQSHNCTLISKESLTGTQRQKHYCSNLTEFLLKNFGWQFVFFAGKDLEKPYGYAIIDHKSKQVYKGGDIIPLRLLTQNQLALTEQITFSENSKSNDAIQIIQPSSRQERRFTPILPQIIASSYQAPVHDESILNSLIDEQLFRLDTDAREDSRQKKKKKRKI